MSARGAGALAQLEPDDLAAGRGRGAPPVGEGVDDRQASAARRGGVERSRGRQVAIPVGDLDTQPVAVLADADVDVAAGVDDAVGDELTREQRGIRDRFDLPAIEQALDEPPRFPRALEPRGEAVRRLHTPEVPRLARSETG